MSADIAERVAAASAALIEEVTAHRDLWAGLGEPFADVRDRWETYRVQLVEAASA